MRGQRRHQSARAAAGGGAGSARLARLAKLSPSEAAHASRALKSAALSSDADSSAVPLPSYVVCRSARQKRFSSPAPASALPEELTCPLTFELMVDPVVTADGQTYKRWAIEEWLATRDRAIAASRPPRGAGRAPRRGAARAR